MIRPTYPLGSRPPYFYQEYRQYCSQTEPFTALYANVQFNNKESKVGNVALTVIRMRGSTTQFYNAKPPQKPYGLYADYTLIVDQQPLWPIWNNRDLINEVFTCTAFDASGIAVGLQTGTIIQQVDTTTRLTCKPFNSCIEFLKISGTYTFAVSGQDFAVIEWKENRVSQMRFMRLANESTRVSCMVVDAAYKKIIIGLDTGKICKIDWDFDPKQEATAIEEIGCMSSDVTCLQIGDIEAGKTHLFVGTHEGLFDYNTQSKECSPLIENRLITSLEWVEDKLFVGVSKITIPQLSAQWKKQPAVVLCRQQSQRHHPTGITSAVWILVKNKELQWEKQKTEIDTMYVPTFIKAARIGKTLHVAVGNMYTLCVFREVQPSSAMRTITK